MRVVPIASLCLVLGCQSTGIPRATNLPSGSDPCLKSTTADACATLVAQAAERGDRERVGQLLTLAADWMPEKQRVDVARAATWLAPNAWAPADVVDILADHPAPASTPVPKQAGLLLRGAALPDKGSSVSVDLAIPPGEGPWAGRLLAVTLALASGAHAVAWDEGGKTNVAAATPLFDRIAAMPAHFDPASWSSAMIAGTADSLMRQGQRAEAYIALGRATQTLPKDASPCRTAGWLQYQRWTVAGPAFAGTGRDHYKELRDICLNGDVPAEEQDVRDYLRELSLLELHRGTETFALPREWMSDKGRPAYVARIDALADRWSDGRSALLRALRDEMLARTQQPKGACDAGFTERWKKEREASRVRLASLGRDDLSFPTLRTTLAGRQGFGVEGVDELLAWVDMPEHRWVRLPTLTGALASVEYASPSPENAKVLAPICRAAHDEILADIGRDQAEGYESRNIVRMFALFRGAAVCGPPETFGDVADAVLASAQRGGDGKFGVWTTLGLSAVEIANAALKERIPQALMSGLILRGAVQRLRSKLGSSDEDVVLDASLGIVLGGIDGFTTERNDLPRVLDGVVRRVEPVVARAVEPGSPKLVGYAPAVHLTALALLVAVESKDVNLDRKRVAKARFDQAIERDVALFTKAQGVEQHAGPIVRLMRSLADSAHAIDDPVRVADVMKNARAASQPGTDERRWWSVGLNIARVVALDVAAYAAVKDNPKLAPNEVMADADNALVRLAENAQRDFSEQGPGLEALHLLPALHRGTFAGLTAPEDTEDRFGVAFDAAGKAASSGLERMNLADTRAENVGFLAVLVDALRLANAKGGPKHLVDDKVARRAWAEALASRAQGYPAELSLIVHITAGIGEYEAAPAEARKQFQTAAALATEANPRNVPYLPKLVEAAVMHHAGDTAGAMAAVDEVLATGEEARSCRAPHEVDALLPYRAWAAERLGKHGEADEALRTYLERLEVFSGEGKLHCRLGSYRPTIVFTLDASQLFGRLFFRGETSTGSLQSGLGFGDPRNEDRLVCFATPELGSRPDVKLVSHLMRAVYAFRAGDERAAHLALGQAVTLARRLEFADDVTVGMSERLYGDLAKKEAQLSLVAWAAAVVRARGHISAADALERFIRVASSVERDRTLVSALEDDTSPPSAMEALGFDDAGPWVRATWDARVGSDAAALRRIPGGGDKARALASWQWVLLAAQTDPAHAARLRTLHPTNPLQRVLVERVRARLEARAGKAARPLTLQDVKTLADAGLYFELVPDALDAVAHALANKDETAAGKLVDLALASVSAAEAPLARADLLLGIRTRWPKRADTRAWAEALEQVHTVLEGRVLASDEVAALHAAASVLGREGAFDRMGEMLARLHTLMQRALGEEHPQAIGFAVASLAAKAAKGQDVSAEAKTLLAVAHKQPRLDPNARSLLEGWASGADMRSKATSFLQSLPLL